MVVSDRRPATCERRRPCAAGRACASGRGAAVLGSRSETDASRDVGDHVDEDAGSGRGVGGHELSKPSVTVASWSAERIGPMIIAAPQRGHAHVALIGASRWPSRSRLVAVVVRGCAEKGAREGHAGGRQVFARNPDCRMRTKPRGRMCWTKRRRNSIAERVMVRRWSPWA